MKQIAALIAGIVQNPAALEGLGNDLQGLAGRAGLSAADFQRAAGVANAISAVIQRWSSRNGSPPPSAPVVAPMVAIRPANRYLASADQGVAITAALSLLAVAGAVAVVGTVSVVALAKGGDQRSG